MLSRGADGARDQLVPALGRQRPLRLGREGHRPRCARPSGVVPFSCCAAPLLKGTPASYKRDTSPCCEAYATIWERLRTPSLAMIEATSNRTVLTLTTVCSA